MGDSIKKSVEIEGQVWERGATLAREKSRKDPKSNKSFREVLSRPLTPDSQHHHAIQHLDLSEAAAHMEHGAIMGASSSMGRLHGGSAGPAVNKRKIKVSTEVRGGLWMFQP